MAVRTRDLDALAAGIARWWSARAEGGATAGTAGRAPVAWTAAARPNSGSGYSNEIAFVTLTPDGWSGSSAPTGGGPVDLVVRVAPEGAGLFPAYDLGMQAAVMGAAAAAGVPVPEPVVAEDDPAWIGAPFLVMGEVTGSIPSDAPAFDAWITDLGPERQRALHDRFVATLVAIHRVPVDPAWAGVVPGMGVGLVTEIERWAELAAWAFDGDPPPVLVAAYSHCRATAPAAAELGPPGLLWGDVRLGNVIFGDAGAGAPDLVPTAVLDWEMASVGPVESDVAWYTALGALTERFVGTRVEGFPDRDEVIAQVEAGLGRSLIAMPWFETWAVVRATTLSLRTDRLRALRKGRPLPEPEANFMVAEMRTLLD